MNSTSALQDILEQIDQAEARFDAEEARVQAFLPEPGRFTRLRREAGEMGSIHERLPLAGWLAGVKDIFHVDGFETHGGSRLPAKELGGVEARSASRVKSAGALILGKTVTTEFAYFAPGPTRNPHNPEHTPGGSSSGSAAAVAVGLCRLALGTQTIGSIIRPASFCGVVGVKPSYDRISRQGVIPLAPSFDHIGYFVDDVAEAQQAARILYEDWSETGLLPRKPVLGIPSGPYLASASSEGLAHFESMCNSLTRAGYELRRVAVMPDFQEIRARHDLVLAAQAAQVHVAWFAKYSELYAPRTAELIRRGQSIDGAQLETALHGCMELRSELMRVMDAHGLDAWISPAAPGPAPRGLQSTGDPVMNLPWTQAGLPAINLPAGRNQDGLPMGLQVIGRWYADESLLGWAADLEKVLSRS
jgi:Asp-tRNA(Asn)/Glu-tRNA(Gln) amidotransferase A subunit family amidase